ncbi:MAG: hypothetical protein ACOYOZ_15140, partial [Pirellula sp.]
MAKPSITLDPPYPQKSHQGHTTMSAFSEIPHRELVTWVMETAKLCEATNVVWCDGSQEEWDRLTEELVASGTLLRLNPDLHPNSFLARSSPSDTARVEERTFMCSRRESDAGPTNNWTDPEKMRELLIDKF